MDVPGIKETCKKKNIKGYSTLNKPDLVKKCCMPTKESMVQRWKSAGLPMPGSKYHDERGEPKSEYRMENWIRFEDGKLSIDDMYQDLIDDDEDWDNQLAEIDDSSPILSFLGSIMAKGASTSVTVECNNDSTDVEWTKDFIVVKLKAGKVKVTMVDESWHNPDDDDDDDD
jgi:hypothetical protein